MAYRELQAEAKRLGIKANQGAEVLRKEIAKLKTPSSPRRSLSNSPKKSRPIVKTIDMVGAEWVVFSGRHIFLDDETRAELEARLAAYDDDIKLLFYYDGEEDLSMVYPPLPLSFKSIEVGAIYNKALEDENGNKHYPFTGAAIGFNSGYRSLDIHDILREVVKIGGMGNPISTSIINDDSLGDESILVLNFDTYI